MEPAKLPYSPEQILEAGRRAEAQGQTDYAVQFYKHLTNFHQNAQETRVANDALRRIASMREATSQLPMMRNGGATPSDRPHPASPANAPQGPARPLAPIQPAPVQAAWPPSAEMANAAMSRPIRPDEFSTRPSGNRSSGSGLDLPDGRGAAVSSATLPAFLSANLPPPLRGYRLSRVLAWVVILVGTGFGIAGVALTVYGITAGRELAAGFGPLPVATAGAMAIGLGLVLVFAGQTARAIFDTANATRDVALILRALADPGRGRRDHDN